MAKPTMLGNRNDFFKLANELLRQALLANLDSSQVHSITWQCAPDSVDLIRLPDDGPHLWCGHSGKTAMGTMAGRHVSARNPRRPANPTTLIPKCHLPNSSYLRGGTSHSRNAGARRTSHFSAQRPLPSVIISCPLTPFFECHGHDFASSAAAM